MRGRIIIDADVELGADYAIKAGAFEALCSWSPRLKDALTVSDANGRLFRARVTGLGRNEARVCVFEENGIERPPFLGITLLQALPEKERMELIIQKTTELGIGRIIPFKSQRSISLDQREHGQRKSHKWQEIALKASRQSRRSTIAEVLAYTTFDNALEAVKDAQLKLMLSEQKNAISMKALLKKQRGVKNVAVMSGPEGGFTENEFDAAKKEGFNLVSLGNRVLRAETASILAAGLLQYELGG